jgi:hypothetical protein
VIRALSVISFVVLAWFAVERGLNSWADRDATMAYWSAWEGGLYDRPWLDPLAYVYSPAFAQVLWPFTLLPFDAFAVLWAGVLVGALAWLVGPILAAILVLLPHELPGIYTIWFNVSSGNISLLLAVAVVLMFRWPASGAFLLLTKVTPGVGLVWFGVRREWRSLAIALGVTVGILAVSALIAPHLWVDWIALLRDSAGTSGVSAAVPIPVTIRLPIALLVVAVAAWRTWPWLVPVGVMLALPQVGVSSLVLLLAIPRLRQLHDPETRRRVGRSREQGRSTGGRAPLELEGV